MKQFQIIIVSGIIILGVFCYTLLQPGLWKNQISNYCNNNLLKGSLWKIDFGDLNGNMLSKITGKGMEIYHSNGNSVTFSDWSVKLNILNTLFRLPSFEVININDCSIHMSILDENISDSSTSHLNIIPKMFPDFQVKSYSISGSINVENKFYPIAFSSQGSVKAKDNKLSLQLNKSVINDSIYWDKLEIDEGKIRLDADEQNISMELEANWKNIPIHYSILLNDNRERSIESNLEFKHFKLVDYLPDFPKINPDFNQLSGYINFDVHGSNTRTNLKLWNDIGDTIPGKFDLDIRKNIVIINNGRIEFNSSSLDINFMLNPEGRLAGSCYAHHLKLDDWFNTQSKIILDGDFNYEGVISNDKIREWSFSSDVLETGLLHKDTLTVSVSGAYDGTTFELTEPLIAILNGQYVKMDGFFDIPSSESRWTISSMDMDLALLPFKINGIDIDGKVTGSISANGDFASPSIELDLLVEDVNAYLFSSSRLLVKGDIQNPEILQGGGMNLTFENGKWSGFELGEGELDMTFDKGDIFIKDISTISRENFLQASGKIIQRKIISLDRIQMAYDSHYLAIPQSIEATLIHNGISVKPFVVHVDDGVIEGVLQVDSKIDGRIKMSNIDGGFINKFFPKNKLDLYGLLFGEIGFTKTDLDQSVSFDMTMKNGQIYNQVFNDLTLSAVFKKGTIHIEEFSLTNKEQTGIQITGSIPIKEISSSNTVDISSHFSFLNTDILTQFIPDGFPIEGIVSGNFNLKNENSSPLYEFYLTIKNGSYDKIDLGAVSAKGYYRNNMLTFDSFTSTNSKGDIKGSASLPMKLDYNSIEFGNKVLNEPVDINVRGSFNHMKFLTDYLSIADSLRGTVNIELSINGGWEQLIRNGKISLEDCRLYTSTLGNPITKIDGEGTLKQNILNIDQFQCMKSGNKLGGKNLFVNGNIDLTQFFNPNYDLLVSGEKLFFKSLTDDVEGDVNIDLNIAGRDTVSIVGTILLNELMLFKEFTTSVTIGKEVRNEESSLLYYDIDFPIKESISLVNSQIDAKLSGELHYTKWGNNTADYSGELFFTDGKFYYYSEVFTISEGLLYFTRKGFNPTLDIIAMTDIEDEEIQISFTGPLNEPNLTLSSESGFSQSDILELLTWGKRFEDESISYTGLGNQAAEKLKKWLDTQFDRKIMEMSGLNELGILEEVQIEGATGLFDPNKADAFSIKAGLSKKISLQYAYHRSFSLTNPSHMVGIEYKVNRHFSLLGNVDENGRVHAKYRLRYSY